MKIVLKLVSFIGLGMTIIPAFLVFYETIQWDTHANVMIAGTILWFITAPFWIKEKSE